jgi:TonB family protein
MEKIVKYCSTCEESFAEKFSFCPNCANELNAFEMKPLQDTEAETPTREVSDEPVLEVPETSAGQNTPIIASDRFVSEDVPLNKDSAVQSETVFEPVNLDSADQNEEEQMINAFAAEENETAKAEINEKSNDLPETMMVSESANEIIDDDIVYDDYKESASSDFGEKAYNNRKFNNDDDGYNITVIKEKNVKQRNGLLIGSFLLMTSLALGGLVYSIFDSPLLVGAINDDGSLMAILNVDEVPIDVDEPPKKKDDKKGGGGGGGGKEEERETSKGVLADQTEKPQFPPTSRAIKLTSPSLMIKRSTQGPPTKRPPTEERYGNPNSVSTITSDGKGSGGGMGSGRGTGQGSGIGTGEGSGIGSGSGSGIGDGIGDGTGSGTGGRDRNPPPPPVKRDPPPPAGPTTSIEIISKPKPSYTDSARTNNVQGTVLLSVTFLSNGSIGGVSSVKGLPDGLTEKAIVAARQIQFKPALKNGQPQTVTKRIQYSFTIY